MSGTTNNQYETGDQRRNENGDPLWGWEVSAHLVGSTKKATAVISSASPDGAIAAFKKECAARRVLIDQRSIQCKRVGEILEVKRKG